MVPRGTVGRIYKEEHYTLLQTKYESSGPCGFGQGPYGPQGHGCEIYKEDHYTLLLTKYDSSGPCGFGEDFFMFFPL